MRNASQKNLLMMNRKGSVMKCTDKDGLLFDTIMDSVMITRTEEDAVWLFWKSLGYDQGPQYAHTTKIVEIELDEIIEDDKNGAQWAIVDLVDDRGRKYNIELIHPQLHPDYHKLWVKWTKYKNDHKDAFRKMDDRLLEEHKEIADEWK